MGSGRLFYVFGSDSRKNLFARRRGGAEVFLAALRVADRLDAVLVRMAPHAILLHPGEGRGPVGKARVMTRSASQSPSPNWAPAFAGVVVKVAA